MTISSISVPFNSYIRNNMNPQLIIAKQTELDEIARLADITWNEHYVPIIGQKQVDYMLEKIYSEKAMQEQYAKKGHMFYFVELNGRRIGFIAVTHLPEIHEVFIHKFYLLQQKQKQGLGTQVFNLLCSLYPGNSSYKLTVNRQNYKSINFYFKNGFVIERVADFDIGEGYFMNDFVMVKKLV
jgi:RimJ/RimL family protein N-acetyltransferase